MTFEIHEVCSFLKSQFYFAAVTRFTYYRSTFLHKVRRGVDLQTESYMNITIDCGREHGSEIKINELTRTQNVTISTSLMHSSRVVSALFSGFAVAGSSPGDAT